MVVEPKVARRLPDAIDELKGTHRDTAPTREKILERIESELNSVYQYLDAWMISRTVYGCTQAKGSAPKSLRRRL
jgi:hypothetical protein